mmetsp:Transcript_132612/g.369726  ORF Transcript_132612/g.369726 Transcript_132612/m.369726 type:complete len:202 (+) Transcript_132612:1692-2297(+)
MASCASVSTCLRAALSATTCFEHLDSKDPIRTFSFTRVLRASWKGPLVLALMLSRCAFSVAWPRSTASSAAWSSFSASSIASNGLSKSAPRDFARFSAAGTAFSTLSWSLFTSSVHASIMFLAARLSTASWRRFFSPSMSSLCCCCASATLLFSAAWRPWTLAIRGLSFPSSAFVSARGPLLTPRSSSLFWSMYLLVELIA